jgi:acyl-CoA thioesterase-2
MRGPISRTSAKASVARHSSAGNYDVEIFLRAVACIAAPGAGPRTGIGLIPRPGILTATQALPPTLTALDHRMPPKKQKAAAANSRALDALVRVLDLEPLEQNLYRGKTQAQGWQRVYGGLVLAQALVAATRTVEPGRRPHSMHGYFLLGGDPGTPIIYDVERVRDGSSFNTRLVKAIQHGRPIFVLSVSFHKEEHGYQHQTAMPDVPPPESLPDLKELQERHADRLPANLRGFWQRDKPFEVRPLDINRYLDRAKAAPRQSLWIRATGQLADDDSLHRSLLAYASDFTLLDTALIAHGKLLFDTDIQLASISRDVAACAGAGRRLAALHAGEHFCRQRARILPWQHLHAIRHTRRFGHPGRAHAIARHGICGQISSKNRFLPDF